MDFVMIPASMSSSHVAAVSMGPRTVAAGCLVLQPRGRVRKAQYHTISISTRITTLPTFFIIFITILFSIFPAAFCGDRSRIGRRG